MTTIDISPEAVERMACILEGRGGFVKDSTITATLRAQSAALTQSRVETAAVIERAAQALDDVAEQWSCGHPAMHCDCARDIEQWTFAADEVRALATHDQSSALAAIEAAAEARGMRKAAAIARQALVDGAYIKRGSHQETPSSVMFLAETLVSNAILAAIPQGEK